MKNCVECGRPFAPHHPSIVCCSEECKRARKRRQDRSAKRTGDRQSREWRIKNSNYGEDLGLAVSQAIHHPVSMSILSKARTKPEGTSDVRWRIELRRRAQAKALGRWGAWLTDGN